MIENFYFSQCFAAVHFERKIVFSLSLSLSLSLFSPPSSISSNSSQQENVWLYPTIRQLLLIRFFQYKIFRIQAPPMCMYSSINPYRCFDFQLQSFGYEQEYFEKCWVRMYLNTSIESKCLTFGFYPLETQRREEKRGRVWRDQKKRNGREKGRVQ